MRYRTLKKVRLTTTSPAAVRVPYDVRIDGPEVLAKAFRPLLDGEVQEVFLVVLLDVKNSPLGYTEIARGAIDTCQVDLRMVFRAAIVAGALGVIVLHNHPSGDPAPSAADVELTRRVCGAGKLLGIQVHDHVILGSHATYWSMAAHEGWQTLCRPAD